MNEKNARLLKCAIWFYISIGVLIMLAVVFACFISPFLSPEKPVSPAALDLMEKALLLWGIILLPFLKIGEAYLHRNKKEKRKK
jgi:hypothetical protein